MKNDWWWYEFVWRDEGVLWCVDYEKRLLWCVGMRMNVKVIYDIMRMGIESEDDKGYHVK